MYKYDQKTAIHIEDTGLQRTARLNIRLIYDKPVVTSFWKVSDQ